MITFNKNYFALSVFLLVTEVLIALYFAGFIRHYLGDFLVVILLYCLVRSLLNIPVWKAGIGVLLFACVIEAMQYGELLEWIGLGNSKIANVVLGNFFDWGDILAYTLGIVFVIIIEEVFKNKF
ncbi:DUF2809 domain-containing protein [soil metagenome]